MATKTTKKARKAKTLELRLTVLRGALRLLENNVFSCIAINAAGLAFDKDSNPRERLFYEAVFRFGDCRGMWSVAGDFATHEYGSDDELFGARIIALQLAIELIKDDFTTEDFA